ncbi:LOW QUALITY PROTEIN: aldehyde dehydrogenase, dimeric NADP-preferring-like [Diadema antillarum]|uniref:LOW QUALITY PROTEIN: aldehyde dehydrogenase, dimeric NADP-preferring-like n=1 Tax=Diadema antillarum TaxID=105358 RepID=UPI003A86E8DB
MADGIDAKSIVDSCREAFEAGKTRSYEARIQNLHSLRRLLVENTQAFVDAARKDLGKPEFETVNFEIDFCYNEVITYINELEEWMKPEKVGMTVAAIGKHAFIQREPLGVVLIIGAWNYPIQMMVHPLVGALAAGNAVIVKPSEISETSAKLFEELFPKYLDPSCFRLVNGGVAEVTALLEQKFDHIMYTGSGQVGRIVYSAAAKHLTPVTLELGGKSPVYIDENCNVDIAVRRTVSAKFYNAGQTCIAPDYIICRRDMTEKVVASIKRALKQFFGEDPKQSGDFGRIVSLRHMKRLLSLLEDQEIAIGGESNEEGLYIAPTVLVNVKDGDKVMQEEIFGPILPIFNRDSVDEAIKFINQRDKPLALYAFSNDTRVLDRLRDETSSGAFCGNECFVYGGVETLPFGGVGGSGTGCYHGKFTFDTFSHRKACLVDPIYTVSEMARGLLYAPFSERKKALVAWGLRKRLRNKMLWNLLLMAGAVAVAAVVYRICQSTSN